MVWVCAVSIGRAGASVTGVKENGLMLKLETRVLRMAGKVSLGGLEVDGDLLLML